MFKKILYISLLASITAIAQNVPPLPGKITPGSKDKNYFVCKVREINTDDQARMLYGSIKNLWTQAAVGGKFEAIEPTVVRVMASDVVTARNDIYAFYQKYAAAAFIRSPLYDRKGAKSIESVVEKCEADSSRATNVNVANATKDQFIKIDSDADHALFALKQLKTPLPDDKLVHMYGKMNSSSDAFEMKDLITKHANEIKELVKKTTDSKFIKISGFIELPKYSFESSSFSMPDLKLFVERYGYSYNPQKPAVNRDKMPKYDVVTPASMMMYKPANIDEAKLIERERASSSELQLVSYIQVSDAQYSQDGKIAVKGVVSSVEVLNKKGKILFAMSAK